MVADPNVLGGLLGGVLIGLASLLLLFANGRIAGISGIADGLLFGPQRAWRGAFVLGLLTAGFIGFQSLDGPGLTMQADGLRLVVAGLAVGYGTRLGSGCTSGHGVCGIGRRAPRSLVASAIFMGVAVLTVWLVRHTGVAG